MRQLGKNKSFSITDDVKFTPYAIKCTDVDIDDFKDDILPKSTRLRSVIETYEEEYPQVRELVQDVYTSLYKYYPELNDKNTIESEYLFNYGAIKELMLHTKYKEIRAMTTHDMLASLMSAEIFIEDLMKDIDELKDEHGELINNYNKALEELKEALKDEDKKGFDAQEAQKKVEEAREELEKLYKENNPRQLTDNMNNMFNNLSEMAEVSGNWGLGNDGTYSKMSYEDKMDIVNRLKNSKKLKEISKLAGRLKEIFMEGEKAKSKKAHSTIDDITQGNDVSKLVSHELTRFADPRMRRLFYRDYTKRKLTQHEYGGKRKKGKGPIVAMIDCSGSMSGDNEIYAKAVCMTLLDMSRRENRAFLAVHFDSGVSSENLHVNRFSKKDPYNVKEVIDLAEYFGGGGTEFEPPLQRAWDEVDEEREFSKADIVMITDGCAPLSDSFCKDFVSWRDQKNITLFSILIGHYTNTETLEKFSDTVQSIEDLNGEQGFNVAKSLVNHLV